MSAPRLSAVRKLTIASAVGSFTLAIYCRSIQKQLQLYTQRGKWRMASDRDLTFVIKGFAPAEETKALYPYMPDKLAAIDAILQNVTEGGVPRPVGARLLRAMHKFDEEVKALFRRDPRRMDGIYDHIAHATDRQELTLDEITARVLNVDPAKITAPMRFMVHTAISRHPLAIYRSSSIFHDHYVIQPKKVYEVIETVSKWVREHEDHQTQLALHKKSDFKNHPLQQFITKAQRLIRRSRAYRSPTTMANVGPTAQRFTADQTKDGRVFRRVPADTFNNNDRMILKYLQYYCIPPHTMTGGIQRYAGIHIMRATGMYSTVQLGPGAVPLFLQELGVIAPWENLNVLDQAVALPGHEIEPRTEQLHQEAWRTARQLKSGELKDMMEDLRTDFGDLPVYCVDDPTAKEIDDGFSLERVPGSDNTFWLRVHIANPSAFVPHDHPIAQYAALRLQTLYAPERTYSMLPPDLTQDQFSLQPGGRPVLTFSAKVTIDGDVLETRIENGYIRNVIHITHEAVRNLFCGKKKKPRQLVVGGELPVQAHANQTHITPDQRETFHTIRRIMAAVRQRWRENGGLTFPDMGSTELTVHCGKSEPDPHKLDVWRGNFYQGDPIIAMTLRDCNPYEVPDLTRTYLVSTVMNFACWIAGRWCAERNLPVVYDGAWYHPEYRKLTSKNISSFGGQNWLELSPPKGISASTVLPHPGLGVDAYLKTTSPLRRYNDMLAHYQIEATLRYEHERGKQLDARDDAAGRLPLPFTKDAVDHHITRHRWLRDRLRRIEQASRQYWGCQLLFRAFYFNECELPETLPCIMHKPLSIVVTLRTGHYRGYSAVILPLGLKAQVMLPDKFPEVDILDTVEAKIVAVDMARTMVVMEAVRPVKKFERIGEWA